MKEWARRKRGILKRTLVILMVTIILTGILIGFAHLLKNRLDQEIQGILSEFSKQNKAATEAELSNRMVTMTEFADRLGDKEDFTVEESIRVLKGIASRHSFKRMGIILEDGQAYATDDAELDLGKRQYFKDSMKGKNRISNKMSDYTDGKDIIVFSAPIYYKNEIKAVLFGMYATDTLEEILSIPVFDGAGYSYIISKEGEVIVNTSSGGDDSGRNLAGYLSEQDKRNFEPMKELTGSMREGKSGLIKYFDRTEMYMQYRPLSVNGWYLLNVAPAQMLIGAKQYIMTITYLLYTLVFLLFGVMLAILLQIEKNKAKQLRQVLNVDALTGLDSYQKFCNEAVSSVASSKRQAAMIIMDLDRFKLINEQFGQEEGDEALRYIANVWQRWIREGEMFARSIADRFAVLAFYDDREELIGRVEQFIHTLQNECSEEKQGYVFRPSMGIYLIQDKKEDLRSMMTYASMAYAVAKAENGVYYEIYDEKYRKNMLDSKFLEDQMETAYKNEEFILYYQPKYGAQDQKLKGAEVLVRWRKADGTLIPPGVFIPAAEKSGFIVQLDRYIFTKACKQLCDWQEKGLSLVPVSVNLSREHLRDASFVEEYQKIRSETGIPAEAVELEITESAMFENQKAFKEIAQSLHEIGFRILMDDFGTGYSSLMMLKSIPVDVMKLDKSFVDDYNDPRGEKIINCVVQLAKAMHIQITAEGVETEEQYRYLKALDCDMIQGYYFARPMSGEEFEKLLVKGRGQIGQAEKRN